MIDSTNFKTCNVKTTCFLKENIYRQNTWAPDEETKRETYIPAFSVGACSITRSKDDSHLTKRISYSANLLKMSRLLLARNSKKSEEDDEKKVNTKVFPCKEQISPRLDHEFLKKEKKGKEKKAKTKIFTCYTNRKTQEKLFPKTHLRKDKQTNSYSSANIKLPNVVKENQCHVNTKNQLNLQLKNTNKATPTKQPTCFLRYIKNKSSNVITVSPFKKRKIFYSEKQSKVINGVPCVPPSTPADLLDQPCVASLADLKGQRDVKEKLKTIKKKQIEKERHILEKVKQIEKQRKIEEIEKIKYKQRLQVLFFTKALLNIRNKDNNEHYSPM